MLGISLFWKGLENWKEASLNYHENKYLAQARNQVRLKEKDRWDIVLCVQEKWNLEEKQTSQLALPLSQVHSPHTLDNIVVKMHTRRYNIVVYFLLLSSVKLLNTGCL